MPPPPFKVFLASASSASIAFSLQAQPPPAPEPASESQSWNWHVQNTDIGQYHPGFDALYSGPNSLSRANEVRETVSLDFLAGVRLWTGAEAHVDGLMWQGFGLSKTLGIEAFPNSEAFRLGTKPPNVNIPRLFVRQTFGFGGEQEKIEDDALHLAGKQDISRLTLTLGKLSARDVFDNNTYSGDGRSQFMSWALNANEAWDFPADSIGFITGMASELNQPNWALRYGFFQMPKVSNGVAIDESFTRAWGMVLEFERRYSIRDHPGVVRLLSYLNSAHMGNYAEAAANPALGADITKTREYRYKFGGGLNLEQEIWKDVGFFSRLGWSDGRNEGWAYSDVDKSASAGFSVKGSFWHRPGDTFGLAGVVSAISKSHQDFLAAGGLGILAGDGALDYGLEKVMETYYDFALYKSLHGTLDYQFVTNPAFNRARGPVSVFGIRLHWEL